MLLSSDPRNLWKGEWLSSRGTQAEAKRASDFSFSHLCFLFSRFYFFIGEKSASIRFSSKRLRGISYYKSKSNLGVSNAYRTEGACFQDPCVNRQLLLHPSSCFCREWATTTSRCGRLVGRCRELGTAPKTVNVSRRTL